MLKKRFSRNVRVPAPSSPRTINFFREKDLFSGTKSKPTSLKNKKGYVN